MQFLQGVGNFLHGGVQFLQGVGNFCTGGAIFAGGRQFMIWAAVSLLYKSF